MNNYTKITIDGIEVGLTFGMIAAEEWYRLQIEKASDENSDVNRINNTLALADIIFSAAYNDAVIERKPTPNYKFIVNGVDELYSDDEGIKKIAEVMEVYNESRFGKNVKQGTEALKKKLEENERQSQQTGTQSGNLPTAD